MQRTPPAFALPSASVGICRASRASSLQPLDWGFARKGDGLHASQNRGAQRSSCTLWYKAALNTKKGSRVSCSPDGSCSWADWRVRTGRGEEGGRGLLIWIPQTRFTVKVPGTKSHRPERVQGFYSRDRKGRIRDTASEIKGKRRG